MKNSCMTVPIFKICETASCFSNKTSYSFSKVSQSKNLLLKVKTKIRQLRKKMKDIFRVLIRTSSV